MEEEKKNQKETRLSAEEKRKRIQEMAQIADQNRSVQLPLDLDSEGEDEAFDTSVLQDTQNPDRSYKLYYEIRRLLMSYLPKGPENKQLRDWIYEEKNIFLNRGKEKDVKGVRGSDGRMAYISSSLEVAWQAVVEWIRSGPEPTTIWEQFHELNQQFETRESRDQE